MSSKLTEIEELAAKATPGPVTFENLYQTPHDHYYSGQVWNPLVIFPAGPNRTPKIAHCHERIEAELLVQCRNAAPDMARRLREALAHCLAHEHPGVSPGYQQACSEIRKILENHTLTKG